MAGCTKPPPDLVVLNYEEVIDEKSDLNERIGKAFGPGALGVIAIRGIPGFLEARDRLLPQAHTLSHLPSSSLLKLEDETSMFNAGWSHGKEKLGDKPDFAKGSFYFNPLSDKPGSAEDRKQYPVSYPCNVWPAQEMPEFEGDAKSLGVLMHKQVVALSVHIDKVRAREGRFRLLFHHHPNKQATNNLQTHLHAFALHRFPVRQVQGALLPRQARIRCNEKHRKGQGKALVLLSPVGRNLEKGISRFLDWLAQRFWVPHSSCGGSIR